MASNGSTGPRTRKGKAKSSLNATTHGLLGRFNVIGEERVEDYEVCFRGWLRRYRPGTQAEIQMVALAADLAWKLSRLARMENTHFKNMLEAHVQNTPTFKSSVLVQRALIALGTLVEEAESGRVPATTQQVFDFAQACDQVVSIVEAALPVSPLVARLQLTIEELRKNAVPGCTHEHLKALTAAAKEVGRKLRGSASSYAEQLRRVEAIIAENLPLADDKEARKLGRYRAELSKALQQQIDLVERVTGNGRRRSKGSSFREPLASPKLRVVR